jgi:hypothetical protein
VPVHHDQVPEAAADHCLRRRLERPLWRGIDQVLGAMVGGHLGVGVFACGNGVQDVAFGQDADARVLGVDDDGGAHAPR